MKILTSDNSYRTFCDLTAGYRMFCVMSEAVSCGIIDLLEEGEWCVDELLQRTTLQPEEGRRFIDSLVNVGLLEAYDTRLSLSRFSKAYLSRTSTTSQRHVLQFEPTLLGNWRQLGGVLQGGQGSLIREQSPEEYRDRQQLYQRAMAEAATVRSQELWDVLTNLPEFGTIIDIGAGDGTYIRAFLERHRGWHGIACDLPDVCAHISPDSVPHNLSFYPCNILDRQDLTRFVTSHRVTADLLLFSNLCHCYSPAENQVLLQKTAELLTENGMLVVHDFFRDANGFGALYDLHMLVNTYNGRSYSTAETAVLLQDAGFAHTTAIELPSRSLAIVASRTAPNQNISSLSA